MANREHQGLQIALIIFVMLTIILSVTTFMFFNNSQEEHIQRVKAESTAATLDKDLRQKLTDFDDLKVIIGADTKDEIKVIQERFQKDVADYGQAFPDNKPDYRKLITYLITHKRDVDTRIVDRDAHELELQNKIKADDAVKVAEITKHDEAAKKNADELAGERDKFNQDREKVKADNGAIAKQLEDKRKELDDVSKKTGDEINRLSGIVQKQVKTIEGYIADIKKEEGEVTLADGRVTWVNQKTRTIWIDQGSADGLNRQTSFSIVAADENNPGAAPKKAKVEVTRVQGPHLAEARIIDDDAHNPILPGDQIISPIYQPGRPQRFALVGFMDIDGDGESDRARIRDLISINGGLVDAEVTDDGTLKGAVTTNTRYVVRGSRFTDKNANAEAMKNIAKVDEDAKNYGVRYMSVEELISQMGYKPADRTVALDNNARPEDFKPRFPDGVQPRAPGATIEFRRRPGQDAEPAPKSAY